MNRDYELCQQVQQQRQHEAETQRLAAHLRANKRRRNRA